MRFFDFFFIFIVLIIVGFYFLIVYTYDKEPKSLVGNANAKAFEIKTDKALYKIGEKVMVVFNNYSDHAFTEKLDSEIAVSARKDMGNNYGVALIEKEVNKAWIAIEPLWRCIGDCRKECSDKNKLEPNKKEEFQWDQKYYKCNSDGEMEANLSQDGAYRIVAANWDSYNDKYRLVYSNEFVIK